MARQLKVFSTPAGFVNAVVAAPSQKAALEAWGIRENVFANGSATVVTDPELIAQALATPGRIVRVPIGSEEAILKGAKAPARGPSAPAAKPKATAKSSAKAEKTPPPPPPDRGPLTAAEAAVAAAEAHKSEELDRLDQEFRDLQERRSRREAALERELKTARSAQDLAMRRYRQAGGAD